MGPRRAKMLSRAEVIYVQRTIVEDIAQPRVIHKSLIWVQITSVSASSTINSPLLQKTR
jgi:hypothetical protein